MTKRLAAKPLIDVDEFVGVEEDSAEAKAIVTGHDSDHMRFGLEIDDLQERFVSCSTNWDETDRRLGGLRSRAPTGKLTWLGAWSLR